MIIESSYYPSAALTESGPEADAESLRCDWYSQCKLVADVVTAALLLFLTWPLIAVLLLIVKLTSRGSALYKQERLGLHGQTYTIYKIRTMTEDCERETGAIWAEVDDPRVTSFGRFLRRSHLDELPQLWNVLRREMSLVGPRPERPEIVSKNKLEERVPRYRERLRVRPGTTGLAQVQLPADEEVSGVTRKLSYDLTYIRHLGPWLDLRIILATALKVGGVPFHVAREVLALPRVDPELRVCQGSQVSEMALSRPEAISASQI